MKDVIEEGKVSQGMFAVNIRDVAEARANSFGKSDTDSASELKYFVGIIRLGSTAKIISFRDKRPLDLAATVAERTAKEPAALFKLLAPA
jgi:hypothetical protein